MNPQQSDGDGLLHCKRCSTRYAWASDYLDLKAERDRYRAKLNAACRERDEAYDERSSLVGERERYREALVALENDYPAMAGFIREVLDG